MFGSVISDGKFSGTQNIEIIAKRKALRVFPSCTSTSGRTPSGPGLLPSLVFFTAVSSSSSVIGRSSVSSIGNCSISSMRLASTSVG